MFWEALPFYLQIGMSAEEYWQETPRLAAAYREAYTKEQEERNAMLWLQGQYVYEAFAIVMHNAFRSKGTKPLHYPNTPYRITPPTEEEKKAAAEAERKKAIASLTAWKAAWDQKNA